MGGSQSKEASAPPQATPASTLNTSQAKKEEDWKAPLASRNLPKDLQQLVDKEEENVWDQIYDGQYVFLNSKTQSATG